MRPSTIMIGWLILATLAALSLAEINVDNNMKATITWERLELNASWVNGNCKPNCRLEIKACIKCNSSSINACSEACIVSNERNFSFGEFGSKGNIKDVSKIKAIFTKNTVLLASEQDWYTFEVDVSVIKGSRPRIIYEGAKTFFIGELEKNISVIAQVSGTHAKLSPINGSFTVKLNFTCHEDYYGRNCRVFCEKNAKDYDCVDNTGKKQCHKSQYPSETNELMCKTPACSRACTPATLNTEDCDQCGVKYCKTDFHFAEDRTTCVAIVNCDPPCQNNGVCLSDRCSCLPEFDGAYCEISGGTTTSTSEINSSTQTGTAAFTTPNPAFVAVFSILCFSAAAKLLI